MENIEPHLVNVSPANSLHSTEPFTPVEQKELREVVLTVPVSSPGLLVVPICSPSSHHHHSQRLSCSGPLCRICHEDDSQEELISPCECAGSLARVHASCIEKWLSSSNTTVCEICKYQFSLNRHPKSIYQWLHSTNTLNGPSGFYGDVVCLVLLTPLCIVSVYLCAFGARVYIIHGLWEGTGLAMLCCFLMGVYLLWCFVTIRFHWKRLRRWQATNQSVKLLQKSRLTPKIPETEKEGSLSILFNPPQTPSPYYMQSMGIANPAAQTNDC